MNSIRYALATICIAASVGCLALWWRSMTHIAILQGPAGQSRGAFQATVIGGVTTVNVTASNLRRDWKVASIQLESHSGVMIQEPADGVHRFGAVGGAIYFPIWYASLIFALAGVAALKVSRQFSIRSGLICVSVVAALLGMVVAL